MSEYIPCWNCALKGNDGEDGTGRLIAYCLRQHIIVDPDLGCDRALVITPHRGVFKRPELDTPPVEKGDD